MTKLFAALALAGVAIFLGASVGYVVFIRSEDAFAACRQGQIAGGDIGGPFTLVNPSGQTVTDKDVLTKPSLVYFGYTFCPDVCPLDVARNVETVDLLDQRGIEATAVFITVDPERDTPGVLRDYAANLHPDLIALTGSAAQVKAAAKAYKVVYAKQQSGDEFSFVDHTTYTYLVLPNVGFVDFFRRDVTSEQMAESVACFVQAGKTAI